MNLVWGGAIVVVVAAVSIAAMLLVRRSAPAGSRFTDGDRASGVFGVLATGFSVLLGFLILLTFTSYDAARAGAEAEATIVAQQLETAQFLDAATSRRLTGELVCYARSASGAEWRALAAGTLGASINPWGVAMFRTIRQAAPVSATQQSAYDRWMDQTTQREQARTDRIHGAEGIVPGPLWAVLLIVSALIFGFVLLFADSAEGRLPQAMLMGSVSVVVTLLLLLLVFFDHPHGPGVGRLEPTAMQRTEQLMTQQLQVVGAAITPPCDEQGNPA